MFSKNVPRLLAERDRNLEAAHRQRETQTNDKEKDTDIEQRYWHRCSHEYRTRPRTRHIMQTQIRK